MKFLRSLKLSGMVFFVTGVVYLVGWEQQTAARIDRGFVLEPNAETRILLSQYHGTADADLGPAIEDQ
jgi:hypothetical protein